MKTILYLSVDELNVDAVRRGAALLDIAVVNGNEASVGPPSARLFDLDHLMCRSVADVVDLLADDVVLEPAAAHAYDADPRLEARLHRSGIRLFRSPGAALRYLLNELKPKRVAAEAVAEAA